jgi:hypothetical protein
MLECPWRTSGTTTRPHDGGAFLSHVKSCRTNSDNGLERAGNLVFCPNVLSLSASAPSKHTRLADDHERHGGDAGGPSKKVPSPMLNNARALSPQQSITEFACQIHDVARRSIAIAAIEIIIHLIDGPHDVGSLARVTCLDIATVSKKLTNLRRAGLVICRHDGSRHVYALRESVTQISLGELCLVLIPVEGGTGGVFAIGITHTMLDRLQNGEKSPRRPRAA